MNNTINALHRWFGFLPLRHGQEQAGVVSSGVKKFRPSGGSPDPTGSPTAANTIGITDVATGPGYDTCSQEHGHPLSDHWKKFLPNNGVR